jgi:hypothetical protein
VALLAVVVVRLVLPAREAPVDGDHHGRWVGFLLPALQRARALWDLGIWDFRWVADGGREVLGGVAWRNLLEGFSAGARPPTTSSSPFSFSLPPSAELAWQGGDFPDFFSLPPLCLCYGCGAVASASVHRPLRTLVFTPIMSWGGVAADGVFFPISSLSMWPVVALQVFSSARLWVKTMDSDSVRASTMLGA